MRGLALSTLTLLIGTNTLDQKENVETIRKAAMQGNLDRVERLLDMGFSADAESVRGALTAQKELHQDD
jgi:hypothetical protein